MAHNASNQLRNTTAQFNQGANEKIISKSIVSELKMIFCLYGNLCLITPHNHFPPLVLGLRVTS